MHRSLPSLPASFAWPGTQALGVSVPGFITSAIIKLTHFGEAGCRTEMAHAVPLIHKWAEGSEKEKLPRLRGSN